jgi:TPR repeat protein
MDSPFEKVKAEIFRLHAERERFWAHPDAKSCSVTELIERFLGSTELAEPDEDEQALLLSWFADDCYSHLGWSGSCDVYEYIIANELHNSHTYLSWTMLGEALMKDAENLGFDQRVRVAADVEAVYERAAEDLGHDWEINRAYFYYDHPLKATQPEQYLLKSKGWFERAMASGEFNECGHHDTQTLGNVFFELGDFETALHWYKKFAAAGNPCGDACVLDTTLAEKRLVECQQRMTQHDA